MRPDSSDPCGARSDPVAGESVRARNAKSFEFFVTWMLASTPYERLKLSRPARPPVPSRLTKMPPKLERPTSRIIRTTPKLLADVSTRPVRTSVASSVCMSRRPTL
jgi:hypothetical protein